MCDSRRLFVRQAMLCVAMFSLAGTVCDARTEPVPKQLKDIDVIEHLDGPLPLDANFISESGGAITLRQIFRGDRPVLLSMNYSNCPMLCNLQLNGLTRTLQELEWTTGEEFDVVSVSLDPLETDAQARATEQRYTREYGRPGAAQGWHFLTGSEKSIAAVADAVGVKYRYLRAKREYVHPAVIMVCTPDGRISRYLYGVAFEPQTVRLSLVEASEGKIGSSVDRFLLFCFHYDENEGKYGADARNLMKAGGALTVLLLGGLIGYYWRRERANGGTGRDQGPRPRELASAIGKT